MTMSVGEKAEVVIEPEWAYGRKGTDGYPLHQRHGRGTEGVLYMRDMGRGTEGILYMRDMEGEQRVSFT